MSATFPWASPRKVSLDLLHELADRSSTGRLTGSDPVTPGLRELVPGLTPSSVEMGVPKPKATTAHGFLNFASLDESEAALAVILSQTRDAGQLVALYAGRPKTPEALERDQQRKAKHVEKAAAYEAEMAAWRRQVWPPSKTVRIAGLWGISDERLVKVIVSVLEGTPSELLRGKHQDTNQLHEYANVHFQSIEDATAALEKLRMAGLGERLRPGVEVDFARNHHAWKNIPKPQPMAWMNKKYGGGRPSGSDGGFRRSSNPDSGYRRPSVSEGGYRLSSGSEVGYRSPSKIGGRTTPQRKGNFGLKD